MTPLLPSCYKSKRTALLPAECAPACPQPTLPAPHPPHPPHAPAAPLLAVSTLPFFSPSARPSGLVFPARGVLTQLRGYPGNRGVVVGETTSIRRGLAGVYQAAHEVTKRVATLKARTGEERGAFRFHCFFFVGGGRSLSQRFVGYAPGAALHLVFVRRCSAFGRASRVVLMKAWPQSRRLGPNPRSGRQEKTREGPAMVPAAAASLPGAAMGYSLSPSGIHWAEQAALHCIAAPQVPDGSLKGREVWPAWLASVCGTNEARGAAGSTDAVLRDKQAMHFSSRSVPGLR